MSSSDYPGDPSTEQPAGAAAEPPREGEPAVGDAGQTTAFDPGQTTAFDPGRTTNFDPGQTAYVDPGQTAYVAPGQTGYPGSGPVAYGSDPAQAGYGYPGQTAHLHPPAAAGYGGTAQYTDPGAFGGTAAYGTPESGGVMPGYPAGPPPGPGGYPGYAPQPAKRSSTGLLVGLSLVLVLLVAGGLAYFLWPQEDDGPTTVSACAQAPSFAAQEFDTAPDGLVATMTVTAECGDGDLLAGPDTRVTILDAGEVLASGGFDFTGEPVVIPGGKTATVQLTFPTGSFFATPETLTKTSGGAALSVDMDRGVGGVDKVEVTDVKATESKVQGGKASKVSLPPGRDSEQVYEEALRRQADYDRDYVLANLNNQWISRLSSKWVGLEWPVDSGTYWTNEMIMDEFLDLRLKYQDARMLRSTEWSVFEGSRPMWITVATETYGSPQAANSWCDREGFPLKECFAQLISNTHSPTGTAVTRG